jgi:hypothetical protein
MFQRRISLDDIKSVLGSGIIIESYPDDYPYPSYLLLGWCNSRPIHIVIAKNTDNHQTIIITVYEPDLDQWLPGFKERKK